VADADRRTVAWLAGAAPAAKAAGVRVLLEPIHPIGRTVSYLHTVRHALRLVTAIDGAGIVIDVAHLWWDPELLDEVRAHIGAVGLVQLANVSVAALDKGRYERDRYDRGDVPVAELVLALDAAGYAGWYEDETLTPLPTDERVELVRANRAWFERVTRPR
jgi:sugar phosphate isomerase/epimerase